LDTPAIVVGTSFTATAPARLSGAYLTAATDMTPETPACSSPAQRNPDKASALIGDLRLVRSAVQPRQSVTDELV
jgi:hypothetical protein